MEQFIKNYWSLVCGIISLIVGYTTLRNKVLSMEKEMGLMKEALEGRIQKVEKYCSELYEKTDSLGEARSAQLEINKSLKESLDRFWSKLESFEVLLRNIKNN